MLFGDGTQGGHFYSPPPPVYSPPARTFMTMDPNIHEAHRRDRRRRRLPSLLLLTIIVIVGASWVGLFGFLGSTSAMGTDEEVEGRSTTCTTGWRPSIA